MSAVERPVEVELKYRVVDITQAERYLVAEEIGSFIGGAAVRSSQIEDRYVDTADGALAQSGFAVRLRRSGRGTIVSVKSIARTEGPGGSLRREELEGPADRTAGPLEWPASDARSLVLELAGDAALIELVTIRQLRRKRVIRDGDTRVELSLDEVDVVVRSRVVDRFVELEAELLKGDEGRLTGLAEVFTADPALAPADGSKLEAAMASVRSGARPRRGQAASGAAVPATRPEGRATARADGDPGADDRLAHASDTTDSSEPQAPGPGGTTVAAVAAVAAEDALPADDRLVVSKTAGVTVEDHIAEAGRKVMRFHLARMLAREAGTRDGHVAQDLHAMRVATRRQRAAWRVFGASFRSKRTKRYRTGLREIAARLGAVRDLDVLLETADAYRADLPVTEQRAVEPLLAGWRRPYPATSRPRHRGFADLDRLRAGPWLRGRPALGRCRDVARTSDRRQVAALYAGVRARGAR